jgi:type IV pilus assembly protein PilY1
LTTPTTSGTGLVQKSSLQQQTIVVQSATGGDGNTSRMSTHAVDKPTDMLITGDNVTSSSAYYSSKLGWYVNLPSSSSGSLTGERVIADPTIRNGRVIFTTAIPDTTSCSSGGTSWIWEFNVCNGDRPDSSVFDTNGDHTLSAADMLGFSSGSGSGTDVANGKQISGIGSSPGIHVRNDGNEDKYTNTSNGVIVQTTEAGGIGNKVRVMWQQIKSK